MIELFYDATPNGRKITIALEEMAVPYRITWVQLDQKEQFAPGFRTLSPSAKMPAIIDHTNGVQIFESGAILLYLAEKYQKLLPQEQSEKFNTLKWLFWQTSTFGPSVGQATHFVTYAPNAGIDVAYSQQRFLAIAKNLYSDLDRHLAGKDYIATDFSIADIAIYPWVRVAKGHGINIDDFPQVQDWADRISRRPSTSVKPSRPDGDGPFKTYDAANADVWRSLFSNQTPENAHE